MAAIIRAFLDGTGGQWDWDDFTSCALSDPDLDDIRVRAGAVELPAGKEECAALKRLAEEAERLAE